ncbi:hypothetical protein B484DRAFT_440946, partial [Ochromonadaceae sp. CCMP2298]
MDNHEVADCRLKHHPHANKSAKPFKESFHGLRYVAAGKAQLKYAEDENGDAVAMGTAPPPRVKTDKKTKFQKKQVSRASPPSAFPQPLNASPAAPQTRDARGSLLDASRQPLQPVKKRGREQ